MMVVGMGSWPAKGDRAAEVDNDGWLAMAVELTVGGDGVDYDG